MPQLTRWAWQGLRGSQPEFVTGADALCCGPLGGLPRRHRYRFIWRQALRRAPEDWVRKRSPETRPGRWPARTPPVELVGTVASEGRNRWGPRARRAREARRRARDRPEESGRPASPAVRPTRWNGPVVPRQACSRGAGRGPRCKPTAEALRRRRRRSGTPRSLQDNRPRGRLPLPPWNGKGLGRQGRPGPRARAKGPGKGPGQKEAGKTRELLVRARSSQAPGRSRFRPSPSSAALKAQTRRQVP